MASKPRSEWSAAYRRRIERAEAKGRSRQAARGHKAQEHVARKQREERRAAETGALTSPQRQKIKRFLRQQAKRTAGSDADELWDDYRETIEANGWAWFLRVKARRDSLVDDGRGAVGTIQMLDMMASKLHAESWMLFYH